MKEGITKWLLRLLSLFLAFVLWWVVSAPRREPVSERAFAAPLSLLRMPRNLIITTPVPDTVSVRLRGRVSDLRAVSAQNLEVPLDLSSAQPGDATVTLSPRAINVPPEIEVMSIDPNQLRFRIEQLRQKVVPIRPFLAGPPPSGLVVGDVTLNPSYALVSGPASQIRRLTEVATERIIMTGRTATFMQNVAVISDSPYIRIINPPTVDATVPLTPEASPAEPAETKTTGAADKKSKKKHTP